MLTTLTGILAAAESGNYAVIAPDFSSLFMARILLEYAEETHTPLILSYALVFKPMTDVRSYARFIQIVRDEINSLSVSVALHLDHATDLADIAEAVDVGYSSVMIDASFESYDVNVERTIKAVMLAHPAGVAVEAELGHVATSSDYIESSDHEGCLTEIEPAVNFVALTGIDALAVAVGTVHGPYRGEPHLDFELLENLNKRISIPLVLHGSSGVGVQNIRQSVMLGIRKINVYSDLMFNMMEETHKELERQRTNPIGMANAQVQGIRRVIEEYTEPSGSRGAAGR